MPAYNAEKYIEEAIQSIIDQTYTNWELIIVDDGSVDRTALLAASFDDRRITVLHQENKGQCAAANAAYMASKGDFIKFFDADDLLSSEMIELQVKKINGLSDCVASSAWGRFHNDDILTFRLSVETVWRDMPATNWLIEAWRDAEPMMQCALWLIPRKIIEIAGLWDESLSLINDFDFISRIIVASRMVLHVGGATLYYRSGLSNSLSGTKTRKAFESAYRATEKGTKVLLEKRTDEAAKLSCANIWQNFIYTVYPHHRDLIWAAKEHLRQLPEPDLQFKSGGYTKALLRIMNWKTVKIIKTLFKRV